MTTRKRIRSWAMKISMRMTRTRWRRSIDPARVLDGGCITLRYVHSTPRRGLSPVLASTPHPPPLRCRCRNHYDSTPALVSACCAPYYHLTATTYKSSTGSVGLSCTRNITLTQLLGSTTATTHHFASVRNSRLHRSSLYLPYSRVPPTLPPECGASHVADPELEVHGATTAVLARRRGRKEHAPRAWRDDHCRVPMSRLLLSNTGGYAHGRAASG
ncbi:hypothetical protein B0H12DRAFT_298929 [Mycena haematopus]|nr:hypothetical protein B0H12DRAFT_298929 [Mycena haematopus]